MGFLSSIFDPGRSDRRKAKGFARQGVFTGGGFTGPGGFAGFDFTNNRLTGDLGLSGGFQDLLSGFQGLSQQGLEQAQGDIPESLRGAGASAIAGLDPAMIQRLMQGGDFAGLGDIFQSSLGTARADPFELGAGISEKLRALSERRNSRLVNRTFDRLKASGKLGTTGGAGIAGELEQNLFDQGLQFDLAGLQAGQGIQRDAFGRVMGAAGGRGAISAQDFEQQIALGDQGLKQFGVESSLFQQFLQNQAQGAGIAGGAAGVSQNIQGIPLQLLQALMGAGTTASNSLFNAANVFTNTAGMAKSPLLEATKMFGNVFGAVKPGGV